jgi:hypothetical protein
MKTLLVTLLLAGIVLASFSQDTTKQNKKEPKATYLVGSAKVTVWENKRDDGTAWKNFKVEKVYKKGDKWETTNSFNETELMELKAAVDKAISEESVKAK